MSATKVRSFWKPHLAARDLAAAEEVMVVAVMFVVIVVGVVVDEEREREREKEEEEEETRRILGDVHACGTSLPR
jgi:hypothetical protein